MEKSAIFSKDRRYRYALWRIWNPSKQKVLFIGLNPSTATEHDNDPTIRRCCRFASDWGYGGMTIVNLFAFCATRFRDLQKVSDPIGPQNDTWIAHYQAQHEQIVAIWGNYGVYRDRARFIRNQIPNLFCIQQNQTGEPTHPLYLRADSSLQPFCSGGEIRLVT